MIRILKEIETCEVCKDYLPLGPRPVVAASESCSILIIGQAPGSKVHKTGIPWDDPSGDRLRDWMGVDKSIFHDSSKIALVPMGFCYPGKGKSGDLPPRPECAPLWHKLLLDSMPHIKLTLLFGQYAQHYYLKDQAKKTLTETVQNFEEYAPDYLPMPHPSPRNNIWLKKNPWFQQKLLPELKSRIKELI